MDLPKARENRKTGDDSCHGSVLSKSATHISMFEPYPPQRRRGSRVTAGIQRCRDCHNRAWGTLGISFRLAFSWVTKPVPETRTMFWNSIMLVAPIIS